MAQQTLVKLMFIGLSLFMTEAFGQSLTAGKYSGPVSYKDHGLRAVCRNITNVAMEIISSGEKIYDLTWTESGTDQMGPCVNSYHANLIPTKKSGKWTVMFDTEDGPVEGEAFIKNGTYKLTIPAGKRLWFVLYIDVFGTGIGYQRQFISRPGWSDRAYYEDIKGNLVRQ